MTDTLYAITDLPAESAEYKALASRVEIIQPADMNWVPAIATVLLRFPGRPGFHVANDDFRFVPTLAECVGINKERNRIRAAVRPQAANCYRFFLTGKAYFAASDVAGTIGDRNAAAWVVAAYVDTHPAYSFWALDVAWVGDQLAVVDVWNGSEASLGDTLSADVFYEALVAKLTGSCCR